MFSEGQEFTYLHLYGTGTHSRLETQPIFSCKLAGTGTTPETQPIFSCKLAGTGTTPETQPIIYL